ncbi:winged helix-turn-helix domain-containing protein [Streptomyces sp. NPDC005438]|uniref:winged helix-turn-helix domain-containing protein n=1 Tax=Streptomyces sp. NPDC005438 TaxID=3156880 RepID=UPI0033AE4AF6
MSVALPAPHPDSRRLRLVPPKREAGTRLVGYLVLVPEGTDPAQLFTDGARPQVHALHPSQVAAFAPQPTPAQPAPATPAPAGAVASVVRPEVGEAADTAGTPGTADKGDSIRIDAERHLAEVDGRVLDLTYLEFELLAHLVAHPHRVHSRESLVTRVWGYGHIGDGRTVDVHIARLRRKLGRAHRDRIVTIRRVGYKYVPAPRGQREPAGPSASCES